MKATSRLRKLELVEARFAAGGVPPEMRAKMKQWKAEAARLRSAMKPRAKDQPAGAPNLRTVTRIEEQFALRAYSGAKQRKQQLMMLRHGWPDFLLAEGDRLYCVEVKSSRRERLRASQLAMFEVLQALGIRVMVWSPDDQDALIPWSEW